MDSLRAESELIFVVNNTAGRKIEIRARRRTSKVPRFKWKFLARQSLEIERSIQASRVIKLPDLW
jgi:hypothetical protein